VTDCCAMDTKLTHTRMAERLGTIWPIVTISLVILGCSSTAPTDSNGAVSETQSLTYDGLERTYRLSVPPTYDETRPMPLVLALHGG
jgi:poly(3-hydroxybutyrate) depolymerase